MEQNKQVCYTLLDDLFNTIEKEHLSADHYFNISMILIAINRYYQLRNTNEIPMDKLITETEHAIRCALKEIMTTEIPQQ